METDAETLRAGSVWHNLSGHLGYQITEWGSVLRPSGHVAKQTGHGNGYLTVRLNGKNPYVHILVAETFIGPRPFADAQCRHLNGDHLDNWCGNLAWGSAKENNEDTVRHGHHWCQQKSHCPLGHSLVEPNLNVYRLKGGARVCQSCQQAHQFLYDRRRRGGVVLDFTTTAHEYYERLRPGR